MKRTDLEIVLFLKLAMLATVIMGRRENVLKTAVERLTEQGVRATYHAGDVRKPESCKAAVQKTLDSYGRLDLCTLASTIPIPVF